MTVEHLTRTSSGRRLKHILRQVLLSPLVDRGEEERHTGLRPCTAINIRHTPVHVVLNVIPSADTTAVLIARSGKLRHAEIKLPTVSRWQRQDLNPASLAPERAVWKKA